MASRKTYRGKLIDMEALARTNEKANALGNMGVNAKGDKLGKDGKVVEPANSRSRTHYNTKRTTVNNRGSLKSEPSTVEKKVFDESDGKASTKESQKAPQKKTPKAKAQASEIVQDNGDIVIEDNEANNDSEDS